jgi:hypothetical protein
LQTWPLFDAIVLSDGTEYTRTVDVPPKKLPPSNGNPQKQVCLGIIHNHPNGHTCFSSPCRPFNFEVCFFSYVFYA